MSRVQAATEEVFVRAAGGVSAGTLMVTTLLATVITILRCLTSILTEFKFFSLGLTLVPVIVNTTDYKI